MYIFSRYPIYPFCAIGRFNQSELPVLGMLESYSYLLPQDHQLSIRKRLSTQNSSPTTVFIMAGHFELYFDKIIAFPIFSVSARWSAKDITNSIPWMDARSINYFILLFDSVLEEGTVHDVLTSLAENFLGLEIIRLISNDPQIHLSSSSFPCLHKFPRLEVLDIDYYNQFVLLPPPDENHLDLAVSWAT